jgi:hypothetical protein
MADTCGHVVQLPTMTVTGTATTCGYGKTPSGSSCVPCPVNTYKPTTNNATCTSCPGTTRTGTVTGARFMGHCTCAPGTYLPSGVAQVRIYVFVPTVFGCVLLFLDAFYCFSTVFGCFRVHRQTRLPLCVNTVSMNRPCVIHPKP